MIITLKGANFSLSNIGTLSTWRISTVLGTGALSSNSVTSVDRESNTGYTTTITIAEGYELGAAGITVTMGGVDITSTAVSGLTISIPAKVIGNVVIKVPTKNISTGEEDDPETPVNPPSGDGTITWELGAINSGGGPNSTDMPTKRIRTAGYLQVESSITIKATGNVEFCPVYYKADKTYISSPNAYQTTDCVVNASQYPLVRLMIRDKTSTSKDLTSSLTELGNSVVITGNFVEIPYDGTSGGGTSGGGTSGTTGVTGIGEGATWQSGAIDSTTGNGSVSMASRIHTGFIPLGNVTVSVSGDAEFCPFFYNADKTYIKPATTPTYQKTTQTWTSADGAYLVLMARNSTATSATIGPSYGANVNIQIN